MGDSREHITAVKRELCSRVRPNVGLLGINILRFKRRIENHRLRLRLLEMKDLPVLCSRYRPEHFPGTRAEEPGPFCSLFSFWRWLKSSFQVFYMIEIKAVARDRITGFVGLYNLEIGRRLYLSAVLFDPEDRRQGYGRQALTLIFNFLREAGVAKEVRAEVFRSNVASLAFLRTVGFEVLSDQGDQFLLVKALDQWH